MKTFTVRSTAFDQNQTIPRKYTGDGEDISPPLSWSDLPAGTKQIALIMDDPDAPTAEPFVHWVLYKIPADAGALPENVPQGKELSNPRGAVHGINSFRKFGYGGPSPPKGHGLHHYHFKVYALDMPLNLDAGETKQSLLEAMQGHILAQGELIGSYQR